MKGMTEYFERDVKYQNILIFVNLYFGSLNNKAFKPEIEFNPQSNHSHSVWYPFVTEEEGCQSASYLHIIDNGLCGSLGWQGGDFAFSASFLILNEIMRPGTTL